MRGPLPRSVRVAYEMGTWLSWLRYYQLRWQQPSDGEEEDVRLRDRKTLETQDDEVGANEQEKTTEKEKERTGKRRNRKSKRKRKRGGQKKKKRKKKKKKVTEQRSKEREKDEWDDDLYIFESDMVTVDKRKGGGVQLVPLECWMNGYADHYHTARIYVMVKRLFIDGNRATKTFEVI